MGSSHKGTHTVRQLRGLHMDSQGVLGNITILLITVHQSSPWVNFFCGQKCFNVDYEEGSRAWKKVHQRLL